MDFHQVVRTNRNIESLCKMRRFQPWRNSADPGDMISTGTPYGVGGFRKIFLKAGDRLRVEIEGVGVLSNRVENG